MQLSPLQSRLVASLAATTCLLLLYFLLLTPKGAFAYEPVLNSFSGSSSWPELAAIDSIEGHDIEAQSSSFYEPFLNFLGRSILGRVGDTTPLENDKPLAYTTPPGGAPICYIIKKGSLDNSTSSDKQGRDIKGDDDEDDDDDEERITPSIIERKNVTIYISANTCLQPTVLSDGNGNSNGKSKEKDKNNNKSSPKPPQLVLYLSNGTDTGCPRVINSTSGEISKGFTAHKFEQGAVTVNITNVTSDIYIGIYAPNIEDSFAGVYDFEVAASSTEYFHQYESNEGGGDSELLWMDSDSTAALLITRNLTNEASETRHIWSEDPPYQLYVSGKDWSGLDGFRRSACGLEKNAPIGSNNQGNAMNNGMVKTSMTLRGPGGLPKQQFYVVGLNATTSYSGMLVRPANVTVNSKRNLKRQDSGASQRNPGRKPGSLVFQGTTFQTNAAPNCKVVTDLEFCDEIQYAVPGNDGKFNNTELARTYDVQAKTMYDNFLKVMQQIPCEADRTSRYSLARTCDDCKRAYKRWLCTVSLPRCEDFHSDPHFSVIRNVNQAFPNGTMLPADLRQRLATVPAQNASRNSFIDQTIQPGPYNELMPCEDICYQVVQSCPSAIQFGCPQPGMYGFNVTYGRRSADNAVVSCNFPGEARTRISGGVTTVPDLTLVALLASLFSLWMVM
ncbi:hypothetical protein E4U21_001795 [Claviceps maximensis]|nr:hypothetical protein E4U21_001795 [Claviceps maximensis]